MSCPHCGAKWSDIFIGLECGSYERLDGIKRAPGCYERQISQLKAELAQCVRRDDPRLLEVANELERGSNMALDNMEGAQGEDFIAWEQVHCDFANQRDKLQSIIEGK